MIGRLTNKAGISSVVIILLAVLITGVIELGCGGSGNTVTINEVKLKASGLPGWTLSEEVNATRANADPKSIIPQLFDAGAVRIVDQVFVNSGKRLQLNYVQMKDPEAAKKAAAMLKRVPGTTNTIGTTGNIAVEVIGAPVDKQLVVQKLTLTEQ